MRITLAHDSTQEAKGAAALLTVLAEHDVKRWIFTDEITIDETTIGASHPLTLGPKYLLMGLDSALAVFLHEQIHWLVASSPRAAGAISEAREQWPDPPDFPDGATDRESTWLHFVVCSLEYLSLIELIGDDRAKATLATRYGYRWIYKTILDQWDWFDGFLRRHGLGIPETPPRPERFSRAGTEVSLGDGLPTLELATGNPREARIAEVIKELFGRFELQPWIFADRVRVQALVPPSIDPPTINTFFLGKTLGVLSQWLWVQSAMYVRSHLNERQEKPSILDYVDQDFWAVAKGPRDELALAACINEVLALRLLLSEEEFSQAIEYTTAVRFYPVLPSKARELAPKIESKGLLAPGLRPSN